MCHYTNTIAKNCHGQLTYCKEYQTYRLLFNNFCIEFTQRELEVFQKFVKELEIEYWQAKYDRTSVMRKIPIQTMQQNLTLVFNRQEFAALKDLVLQETKKPFTVLSVLDVDYTFFLN